MPRVAPFVTGDHRLYELATPLDPAAIADLVDRLGSVEDAAAELQLRPEVVQAAVDLVQAPPEAAAIGDAPAGTALTLVKELLGLFGGIAVLVYVAGGAVLIARLSYEDLPVEATFGQLPREFMITVGIGQVLLPALIAAGAYSLVRAAVEAHRGRSQTSPGRQSERSPVPPCERTFRELLIVAAAIWWVVLFGVTVLVAELNGGGAAGISNVGFWIGALVNVVLLLTAFGSLRYARLGRLRSFVVGVPIGMSLVLMVSFYGQAEADPGFWVATAVALGIAVGAAAVLRDLHRHGRFQWKPGPAWLTLALMYGLVIAVAATAVAATFPFLDARACTSTGFREDGALIGSGERIFLGEPTTARRRIVSMPATDVEQLFIGPDAQSAVCDPRGSSAAVVAAQRAARARAHRRDADRELRAALDASTLRETREPARKLAASAISGGRSAIVVADAANSVEVAYGGNSLRMEGFVVEAVGVAAIRAGLTLERNLTDKAPLASIQELAAVAARRTRIAATAAQHLANRALNVAKSTDE